MKVDVFNVGQGDSFLLKPSVSCVYGDIPLLVDVGPQSAKVANKLVGDKYHLMLTHSHKDHIGGFPKVYRDKDIESLTIPFYLPEILNIAKFIKKKIPSKYGSLDWRKNKKIQNVNLVGEGDKLCQHITVLNPPKSPYHYFSRLLDTDDDHDIEQALDILNNYGFDLPVESIINYNSPLSEEQLGDNIEYLNQARMFVHNFFISLSVRVSGNSIESSAYYADAHFELTANQASIVFKYLDRSGNWLFTGDADQSVFHRIIKRSYHPTPQRRYTLNSISAKYLKVPHHGSRGNLSDFILDYINPEVAIVSHKNRKFGRSNDPLPHHEIIDLLDNNKVRTYYTNPVIKSKKVIKPAAACSEESGVLSFI
ncbi:hypothetical protein C942_04100 [Photobacterium marinum]|uniref:Metallo-beta-lactamase domain-containing protein n=1 Tax=Photobacterium marinum TaxID=1056511 RepID=L8J4G4_9GAMM|nr:hypothetical protein [Photobacterium marinum]ELR63113.1 hypothetical protein C942_04100 [Photobacterium marinum]